MNTGTVALRRLFGKGSKTDMDMRDIRKLFISKLKQGPHRTLDKDDLDGLLPCYELDAPGRATFGPLIDFSPLKSLRNVWFDSQNLTGTLDTLGTLKNLTYLQAAGNQLTGTIPARLCALGSECSAEGCAPTESISESTRTIAARHSSEP